MDIRLRSRVHEVASRRHYQQFDYSTNSESELSDVLLSTARAERVLGKRSTHDVYMDLQEETSPVEKLPVSLFEDVLIREHEINMRYPL